MFVCVLTAVLHYLKCLALRWPTQTQTVLRFSQVLVCHLRTLHLSIFFLTWLKGSKKEEIWQRTSVISGSSCLHKVLSTIWENLLKTVVLLETCWLSCWRYAARNSPLCQLSLFFCCAFSPTHTHIQYIQPSSASLVGNKSVLHTIKWRNECVGSSPFLSRCLWFFYVCCLLCCFIRKWWDHCHNLWCYISPNRSRRCKNMTNICASSPSLLQPNHHFLTAGQVNWTQKFKICYSKR